MTSPRPFTLRLQFSSSLGMLELVEAITHDVGRAVGLDDDGLHWTGLAVRESVINAVHHGNRDDGSKFVAVEFSTTLGPPPSVTICVRDEGSGFDPATLADPLAPENLLNASGRGMLMIRSFMDDVHVGPVAGGMEIRMMKRAPAGVGVERGER
jgi:serine/threonine-protein kinase RsbW